MVEPCPNHETGSMLKTYFWAADHYGVRDAVKQVPNKTSGLSSLGPSCTLSFDSFWMYKVETFILLDKIRSQGMHEQLSWTS